MTSTGGWEQREWSPCTYLGLLHDLVALLPLVGLCGRLVVLEGLAEDELGEHTYMKPTVRGGREVPPKADEKGGCVNFTG